MKSHSDLRSVNYLTHVETQNLARLSQEKINKCSYRVVFQKVRDRYVIRRILKQSKRAYFCRNIKMLQNDPNTIRIVTTLYIHRQGLF